MSRRKIKLDTYSITIDGVVAQVDRVINCLPVDLTPSINIVVLCDIGYSHDHGGVGEMVLQYD